MANKKKKKANKPKPVAAPSTDKLAKDKAEFEASVEEAKEKSKPNPKKEVKTSGKGKEKEKVIKSKARAKDPKKAGKKPNIFRRFLDYIKQVRLEIKRTTWPTGNEVLNMAIIVLVALLFFGTFIFLIDLAMVRLLNLYGHLVPSGGVDPNALVDLIPEEELEDTPASAMQLLGGLKHTIVSLFGGD